MPGRAAGLAVSILVPVPLGPVVQVALIPQVLVGLAPALQGLPVRVAINSLLRIGAN